MVMRAILDSRAPWATSSSSSRCCSPPSCWSAPRTTSASRTRSCSCSAGSGSPSCPGCRPIELDAHVVLLVFVPPLLLSAGWYSSPRELRAESRALGLLALALVLVTMSVVAVAAHELVDGADVAGGVHARRRGRADRRRRGGRDLRQRARARAREAARPGRVADQRRDRPDRVQRRARWPPTEGFSLGGALLEFVLEAAGGTARRRSPSSWVILRAIRRQPDVTVSVLLTVARRLRELHRGRGDPRLGHPRRRGLRPLQRLAPVRVLRRRHAPDRQRLLEDHDLRARGAAVHPARAAAGVGRRRGRRRRDGHAAGDRRCCCRRS